MLKNKVIQDILVENKNIGEKHDMTLVQKL